MTFSRSPKGIRAGIFFALALFFAPGTGADTFEDRVADISAELMCPVCEGQSVAESNSQLARDMRALVRKQLEEGKTREEIIGFFVSSYGETILAAPPPRGFAAVLWALPVLSVLIGAAIILHFVRSYRTRERK